MTVFNPYVSTPIPPPTVPPPSNVSLQADPYPVAGSGIQNAAGAAGALASVAGPIGLGITAATTLGSALIGKNSQKQALKAQQEASLQQLAYANKIEDERKNEWQQTNAMNQAQWLASENARRQAYNSDASIANARGQTAGSLIAANIGRMGGVYTPRPAPAYMPLLTAADMSPYPTATDPNATQATPKAAATLATLGSNPYANRFGTQYNYAPPEDDPSQAGELALGSALGDWSKAIWERSQA